MEKSWLEEIVKFSPDPERARSNLEKLTGAGVLESCIAAEPDLNALGYILGGSNYLSEWILRHPSDISELNTTALADPVSKRTLYRNIAPLIDDAIAKADYSGAFSALRVFKQRHMLRVAARDMTKSAETEEIMLELSDIADVCLDLALGICLAQLSSRLGEPYHKDAAGRWRRTPMSVIGLGKLGGRELNFSSDVDIIFVYAAEGFVFKTPPESPDAKPGRFNNNQFFNRLAETFAAEVSRNTEDGFLFRVDLRLRPEGNTGPKARSLISYENYYAQWGQTWERMMLIKARHIAGANALSGEFLETIQPFRYPRSLGETFLREVVFTKQRIENEVVGTEKLERNVKLGRGGIREIEFIIQTLQLLHAGRIPFLQQNSTLDALDKLIQYGIIPPSDATNLSAAYLFLRDVEHRLQMEENRQTHTIPPDAAGILRLARLTGIADIDEFLARLKQHNDNVRTIYDHLLNRDESSELVNSLPTEIDEHKEEWQQILQRHSFRDTDQALHIVKAFVNGPGYIHVSPRTSRLALELVARILKYCPTHAPTECISTTIEKGEIILSDPDRVLTRIDSFVGAYGARTTLLELWTSHPALFDLMLLLFDRSEFLAETAIRVPDMVDDLQQSGLLLRRKNTPEILSDLRHGLDEHDQHTWLRRYHQTEFMRLGLRDILGLADFEQNLIELTALAEACLQYAVEVVTRRHRLEQPPFAVIGLGKLGGCELTYGSDLDILFVSDSAPDQIPEQQRLALEVTDLLSGHSTMGGAFHIDTRLRPDGQKGLLVNTIDAYENYYCNRARLWEIQTLTRARPIAGNTEAATAFLTLTRRLTDFKQPAPRLSAFSPDWKHKIHDMRARIENERTPKNKQRLAFKTGAGGLMDAEFIAQTLCMETGAHEPNTIRSVINARDHGLLEQTDADSLVANYRSLRRIEGILRRWSYVGESVLPDDLAPFYRVAVRCGFKNPDTFLDHVNSCRTEIRRVYNNFFQMINNK
ncbi:MAG: bifunctional [glutamate--ammonia ligase]-adenylyl-L-tyrosine phosphorylase/[glutamate--ammonia-ligase] adenylyltransferase [Verrucomicrobia bacterium]|nr:bifunctional [glutamate--ammonia ligase]-adenylyl-L-tyrosine phosphorylase/[glutamate--ammonia-ligase] adenylyltransferase [Verrucomicrobiota bacterium]